MHTTVLDNGVRIHYDGSDLGGEVWIVLPDRRRTVTTWDQIVSTGVPNGAVEGPLLMGTIRTIIDENLPPDVIEFRNPDGSLAVRITNLGDRPVGS